LESTETERNKEKEIVYKIPHGRPPHLREEYLNFNNNYYFHDENV
jgi:hypothetical protein